MPEMGIKDRMIKTPRKPEKDENRLYLREYHDLLKSEIYQSHL